MKIPRKIWLQSPIRDLRVERSVHKSGWIIWLAANKDFTLGTYIILYDDGRIQRETIHPDGSVTILEIEE